MTLTANSKAAIAKVRLSNLRFIELFGGIMDMLTLSQL